MAAEATDAVVLRITEFSETSVIVSLLTRDFGRVSAIAKGARRPKSPFEGAIDLLAQCRIMLIRKSGDSLDLLTEAKLQRRFRAGQNDLPRLYCAYYLVEFCRSFTDDGDHHPELYGLMVDAIEALHSETEPALVASIFEARFLKYAGHLPLLTHCVGCGVAVDLGQARQSLSISAGGVCCPRCKGGQHGLVSLTESARRIWSDFADHQDWKKPDGWNRAVIGELRGLANHWVSHVLGHRLSLWDYPVWQTERTVRSPEDGSH